MTDHPDLASAARDAYDVLAAWTDDEAVQKTRQALRAAFSDQRSPRRIRGYDGSRVDCYHWYGDEGEPCGDACRLLDPPPGEDPWDVADTPEPRSRVCTRCAMDSDGEAVACVHNLPAAPEGGQPTDDSHPESTCQQCGRPNICWFVQNERWNAAVPDTADIYCPACFVSRYVLATGDDPAWELRRDSNTAAADPFTPGGQPTDDELLARATEFVRTYEHIPNMRPYVELAGDLASALRRKDHEAQVASAWMGLQQRRVERRDGTIERLERERDEARDHCPHVVSSSDGTSFCDLAETRDRADRAEQMIVEWNAPHGEVLARGRASANPSTLHMDGTSPVVVKVRATTDELRRINRAEVLVVRADQEATDGE